MTGVGLVLPRIQIQEELYIDLIKKIFAMEKTDQLGIQILDLSATFGFGYPPIHNVDARVTIYDLAELFAPVREAVEQIVADNPGGGYRVPVGTEFDKVVSQTLHQCLPISYSQASDRRVWWLVNTVILGDLLMWRWQDKSLQVGEDRFIEKPSTLARSAFSRLWWRAEIFDANHIEDFRGDHLDQILERPRLRQDREIANQILQTISDFRNSDAISDNQVLTVILAVLKRLLRRFAIVNSMSLDSVAKKELVVFETQQVVSGFSDSVSLVEPIE